MATAKAFSFLTVCCFILVLLHSIPKGQAARKLEDIPPNSNLTGYPQDKGQSRTAVHGSESRHAGSATGDNSPSGTVQMPPPKALTRVQYEPAGAQANNGGGDGNQPSSQYNNDYSPPEYGNGNRPSSQYNNDNSPPEYGGGNQPSSQYNNDNYSPPENQGNGYYLSPPDYN